MELDAYIVDNPPKSGHYKKLPLKTVWDPSEHKFAGVDGNKSRPSHSNLTQTFSHQFGFESVRFGGRRAIELLNAWIVDIRQFSPFHTRMGLGNSWLYVVLFLVCHCGWMFFMPLEAVFWQFLFDIKAFV